MAILTEADKPKFFPLVDLTGLALEGAIARAQSVADSAAGRPLDSTQYTEVIEVGQSCEIPLRYYPIDRSKPIAIDAASGIDGFAFSPVPQRDWEIDEVGTLRLKNPMIWKIRVRYWSGLEQSEIAKSAVAAILYYQNLTP